MLHGKRSYLVAAALFGFCLAVVSPALGQDASWGEDKDDDAGSGPREAQRTKGSGKVEKVSGSTVSAAFNASGSRGRSRHVGSQDFEDLYLIWVANPEKFNASLKTIDNGFANFPSSLYLFDVGVRFPDPEIVVDSMQALLGNRDEAGLEGAVLPREATDNTAAKVAARGYYVLAVASAGSRPLVTDVQGNLLELFSFLTSSEVSGPDGEGGSIPVTEGNYAWTSTITGGNYQIGLEGIAFAVPLENPTSNFFPPSAIVSDGQYPVTTTILERPEVGGGCTDQDGNAIEFFNSLWWNFEAKDTGSYRLSTCNETEFDSILGVYKDSGLCQGDINGDGLVGLNDFSTLLVQWGSTGPEADLNNDGLVGLADFELFLVGFGECVPVPELVVCNDDASQCEDGSSDLEWFANSGDRFFLRLGTFDNTGIGSAVLKVGPTP
ncbi:MAG: hypothetical protein P8J86_12030 [Phycisphaerales bacterium]|nr:hypothetical protein [Phycisphaerales bacterium]